MIRTYETDHYVFHYLKDSLAERDIPQIAKGQERCFDRICELLNIAYSKKIGYWFYNSPQLLGNAFFDGALCNGVSITDARTEYMFQTFGKVNYMRFYCGNGTSQMATAAFGKSMPQICREFEAWLSELPFSEEQRRKIEKRMGK